jgi:hypothetical protein
MVRRGISLVAAHARYPADRLLARLVAGDREHLEAKRQEARGLAAKAQAIRRRARVAEDRARLHRLLPDEALLEKLARYEAHLSRQLSQTLHELERLQAARAGARLSLHRAGVPHQLQAHGGGEVAPLADGGEEAAEVGAARPLETAPQIPLHRRRGGVAGRVRYTHIIIHLGRGRQPRYGDSTCRGRSHPTCPPWLFFLRRARGVLT